MKDFVREKRFWLYTKLAEKEALRRPVDAKEFVRGEGFPYLGRSHRLILVDQQDVPLKLERGRFRLVRADAGEGRLHFIRWYTGRVRPWLNDAVGRLAPQLGVEPSVIEYVVVHELAHLHEPQHTPEFWLRVERALPDFERRKQWIAEHGMAFASL